MHFKTVLAHLKSKVFSVGGRHFFTSKLAELTYSFWIRPWTKQEWATYSFNYPLVFHKLFVGNRINNVKIKMIASDFIDVYLL